MQDRVLGMLGLAQRAGRLVSGEEMTINAVKDGSAMLVIVADDASENTKKLFTDKCGFYEVPLILYGTKDTLGRAIGKIERSSLALNDKGFAEVVKKLL